MCNAICNHWNREYADDMYMVKDAEFYNDSGRTNVMFSFIEFRVDSIFLQRKWHNVKSLHMF